jgi:allantoin racemase
MRIKMILPVPMPESAVRAFEAQIPPSLIRPDVQVDFCAVKSGGKILDSYYEMTLADAFVLQAGMSAEDEGYDAVCINSMSDSGLNALRSRLSIPVVGPGQSCFCMAMMLGEKFSVLTMWSQWFPLYQKVIKDLGIQHRLASIRSIETRPDKEELLSGKEEVVFGLLEKEAELAISKDGADVLILGSTTMHQSHNFLVERFDVPVLNPGLIALKICETLVDLDLSHSKGAYRDPEVLSDYSLSDMLTPDSLGGE